MSNDVITRSYVDRRGLDALLKGSLRARRHVVIHGGTKQGKSWIRRRALAADKSLVVQCLPGMTAAAVLEEALGRLGVSAMLTITDENAIEGNLSWGYDVGASAKYVRAASHARGRVSRRERRQLKRSPVGQGPASLSWVAGWLHASGKRPIFEDFHHLPDEEITRMAFIIKALGEMHVHCVIVGIWAEDHLLTFYNGELAGRIDDIRLTWSGEDLRRVIRTGSTALNIEFTEDLQRQLIASSYGSVGLLQQLLEQLCDIAGIQRSQFRRARIDDRDLLDSARGRVWETHRARYAEFVRKFGAVGTAATGQAFAPLRAAMLRALVDDFDDDEFLNGIAEDELLRRLRPYHPSATADDLAACTADLHRWQSEIEVSPVVLGYDANGRRVFLADRGFLFYRHEGDPTWPWRPT